MTDFLNNQDIQALALFSGYPVFDKPKPTSNLVRPDFDLFFRYLHTGTVRQSGGLVEELESRLAVMHGVAHCVTMNSGFWALALLIDALAISGRSEIIMPSLTYRRMADIVSWIGRIPHFCDVDLHTLANSAQTVQPCVNEKTALIIGVHPVGGHCDVGGLTRLGQERGIPVIFDSVESVHEVFLGKPVGSFGTAELFSIGASKLINGFEGGYITTNHGDLADVLRRKRRGCGPGLGLTVPLPDIHAAMALASLDDLPNQLLRNQQRFSIYQKELAKISGLRLVEQNLLTEPSYKNIVMEVLDDWPFSRDQTVQLMNAERMLARSYYCPPLTHKPMSYPHIALDLPHTDTIAQRYISLPCGHLVSIEDIRIITDFLAYIQLHAKDILEKMSVSRASV